MRRLGEAGREVLVEARSVLAVEKQAAQERKGSGLAEPQQGSAGSGDFVGAVDAPLSLWARPVWSRPFVRRVNPNSELEPHARHAGALS